MFIDKPSEDSPVGIWGVDITQDDPPPQLVSRDIAFYTPDLSLRMEFGESGTTIERLSPPLHLADGDPEIRRWTVPPAGGFSLTISPGQTRIAWSVVDENLAYEERISQVWVADLDGENARQIATVPRGWIYGWVSDDLLLMSGRESLDSNEQLYYTLSIADGDTAELVRGERIRGAVLSPDGAWMAYFAALEEDAGRNGLWLARTDGTESRRLDDELFGAYRWRDGARLLIVPFQPDAPSHELWEYDVQADDARRVTDPGLYPFQIANGQWSVSPDGRHVVFVEAADHNLWLFTLSD
jgi:Tol biopolymer transport system component